MTLKKVEAIAKVNEEIYARVTKKGLVLLTTTCQPPPPSLDLLLPSRHLDHCDSLNYYLLFLCFQIGFTKVGSLEPISFSLFLSISLASPTVRLPRSC